MKNKIYILKYIELIEEKLNWSSNANWVDYHFANLSEQIFKETKVLISITTLKRIFRQNFELSTFYDPQIATKNALAAFLNYKDWTHFVLENFPHHKQGSQQSHNLNEEHEEKADAPSKSTKRTIPIWAASGTLALLIVFFIYFLTNKKDNIGFTVKKINGDEVAFSYNLQDIKFNIATLDFGNGKYRTLMKNGELSYPFKLPDFYTVKLITDGEVRTSKKILIPSKGWTCVLQQNQKEWLIVDRKLYHQNEHLFFPLKLLATSKIDTTDEYWVDFRIFKKFDIDGDNFTMELDVHNSKNTGGIDCFDTSVEYIGETGKGRVKFVRPGCEQFAVFEFGEIRYNGNFHDLPLGIDLSRWSKIKVTVLKQKVQVFVNNQLAYTNSYHEPIGNIMGLKYKFKGSGAIDNVKLFNAKNQLVYSEAFDKKE